MIKINFNLLQSLTMNSLNVKHQEKSSNQLVFQLSAYTHLESDISKAYKVQVDCLKESESNFYGKNDMKEKVNDLVRLHKAMQEQLKTASYSEQIQILTLIPDKWSRMYCAEYSNAFQYLFELHMKSKSRWSISKTCYQKDEKLSPLKHFIW